MHAPSVEPYTRARWQRRAATWLLMIVAGATPMPSVGAQAATAADATGDRLVLAAGDTVKLFFARELTVQGILTSVDDSIMRVEVRDRSAVSAYSRSAIERIAVLRGHPHRGPAAVAMGILAGAATGALVGAVMTHGSYLNHEDDGLWIMLTSIAGAAVGTVSGVVVAFTRTERWVPVDPRTLMLLERP